ncbi:hypothetical protein LINGRAHAP2_LOCUS7423 [Linum grandiflorum]
MPNQEHVHVELRKLKSHVWEHYTKIKVNDSDKAKYNYCKRLLGCHSKNGTSHLMSHIRSCVQKNIFDGKMQV